MADQQSNSSEQILNLIKALNSNFIPQPTIDYTLLSNLLKTPPRVTIPTTQTIGIRG